MNKKEISRVNQNEVAKHSATIQIENKITLFQRRGWNVLLAKAFFDLGNDKVKKFEMPFTEFCQMMGYKHTNRKYKEVEELLYELTGIGIRWNILGKDKKEVRGGVRLLAGFEIKDGMCRWDYSHFLREKLTNPDIYARINVSIQNRFNSKYALALYELFADYRGIKYTPWITIKDFRDLMGLEDSEYTEYKFLKYHVINKPLKDINKESDLKATLEVRKEKRRVVALRFLIEDNPDYVPSFPFQSLPSQAEIDELEERAKKNAKPLPSSSVNQDLLKRLTYFGITEDQAVQALENDDDRVQKALVAAEAYIEKQGDSIQNVAAVVNRAIVEGWGQKSPAQVAREERKQAAAAEFKRQQEAEARKSRENEKAAERDRKRRAVALTLFEEKSQDEQDTIKVKLEARLLEMGKFNLDQFRKRGFASIVAKNELARLLEAEIE